MPGSLTYSNYSVLSGASGRSLDSKTGAKKVSFNKAVRVKQYPWKSDVETPAEHLTLPNDRFWFKVYKDKHEIPDLNNASEQHFNVNTEDKMEGIYDALAPIAEVEDYDLGSSNLKNSAMNNGVDKSQQKHFYSDYGNNKLNNHPVKSACFGGKPLDSNHNYYRGAMRDTEENRIGYNYRNDYVSNLQGLNGSSYKSPQKILEESEDTFEEQFNDRTQSGQNRLYCGATRNGRNVDTSDNIRIRPRSRSHDPMVDFQLRKADKSVSTEDLTSNRELSNLTNKFLTGSRDMATQCNGTLTRDKILSPRNCPFWHTDKSDEERLNNFVSPSLLQRNSRFRSTTSGQLKRDGQGFNRPYLYQAKSNVTPLDKNLNNKKQEYMIEKPKNFTESSNRNKNNTKQNPNANVYLERVPVKKPAPRILKEENQTKPFRDSTCLDYLRDRPKETNSYTNRKYLKKNESPTILNSSRKENSVSSYLVAKPNLTSSNALHLKKQSNLKSYRDLGSSRKYDQSDSPMIDWSSSGFKLASRPESSSSSMYTVHKPPTLMYIPGVSHHDCPALDDDRLSHLSDLSRSESREGSILGLDPIGNIRRSYSMPRHGSSKWRNKLFV